MLIEVLTESALLAVGLVLVLRALPERETWARALAVAPLLALNVAYLTWRSRHLPAPAVALGFLWPVWFYGWEVLTLVYESWTLVVLTRIRDRTVEANGHEARLHDEAILPSVDVWVATYAEPVRIVLATLKRALTLSYPAGKFTVYLLDDGQAPHQRRRRAILQKICRKWGVVYLARPPKPPTAAEQQSVNYAGKDGKAGSHRHAFEKTKGEYILQLDADFCVHPEFLYRTLGFLMYRRDVGCVQVPQRFRNPDPVAHNLTGWRAWCEAQHFFMALTEACRDAWGNAFCVGTCCVVSRARLAEIGGYPHATICEDMELTYVLLRHGYRTVVLNEPLAYGLAPESVPEYLKQRVRWCVGTIQHLYIRSGPILGSHRLLDRLFYIEGSFYWLSFVFLVCLLVAPVIFWATGVAAISGPAHEVVWLLLPRLVLRAVVIYWLSLGKVTPVVVTVMNALGALHFSLAALWALVSPFGVAFNVTTKGVKRDKVVVRWKLFLVFVGLAVAMTGLMAASLFTPLGVVPAGDLTPLNVAWTGYSALVCVLCALVCVELPKPARDIWVMREVVRTDPWETAKALGRRLLLMDAIGSVVVADVKRFFIRDPEEALEPAPVRPSLAARAASWFVRPTPSQE